MADFFPVLHLLVYAYSISDPPPQVFPRFVTRGTAFREGGMTRQKPLRFNQRCPNLSLSPLPPPACLPGEKS